MRRHRQRQHGRFRGVVAEVRRTLPDDASQVPWVWPKGQACNLREYLGNQRDDAAMDEATRESVDTIVARLDAYFELEDSYQCGGKTRYQRGG